MSQIGENIKEIRTKYDLSQAKLGKMLGVTGSYISRLEIKKDEMPSDSFISLFCQLFLVRKEWLVAGEYPMHEYSDDIVNKLALHLDYHNLDEISSILNKYLTSTGANDGVIRKDELSQIYDYLKTIWNSSPDMQVWLKVQFKEAFPKFEEWLKEQLEIEKKGKETEQ